MFKRKLILLKTITLLIILPATLPGQADTAFVESFDDGDITHNPLWTRFFYDECPSCITMDSEHNYSPPYSLKISTDNQFSAIESITRIYDENTPFKFTVRVYIESMGDEGIPCLLRGSNTVLALFLLPGGLVQLTVLKDSPGWDPVEIAIPGGYSLGVWHEFTLHYNGTDTTALYIDGEHRGDVVQPLRETPRNIQVGNYYLRHTSTFYLDDMLIMTDLPDPAGDPATVYLILGSDTGTWDGMNVNQYENYYRFGLFSDPGGNGATVINPVFRDQLRDSYNEPLVMTWWLIGGSMMVPNTNPNVEHPWVSNLEVIKEYLGEEIEATGDELALHYHNWIWSDPDNDGTYRWNQSVDLAEYGDDFLETIGRMVLEEELMPSSFRSGWHYMSNEWSVLIDGLIPYRLQNDAPNIHDDPEEPIDNIYDWSRAPLEWIPFHPAETDYQSPGNLRGWETRSVYTGRVDFGLLYDAFWQAYNGTDQVITIWSHLPEADFPQQIIRVDSLVHLAAEYFPDVNFDYVTATEGMQKWRGLVDDIPPQITVNTFDYGDSLEVTIMVDEPIWQVAPLVWANAGGEHLVTLYPDQLSPLSWRVTLQTTNRTYDAIGIGATDTSGNATAKTVWLNPVSISNGMDDMLPTKPVLHSAYPNPFNASTTFKFEIPKESSVNMTIYDALGREVTRLVESRLERGYHQIVWNGRAHDGTDMPSGIYIARLVTPTYTGSVKMVLLK